jgi:hypothetical protein
MPQAFLNRPDEISDSHIFMPEAGSAVQAHGIALDYPLIAPLLDSSGRDFKYVSDFI